METTPSSPRKKVVVLGGGIASLAAVYRLTSEPDWRDRFESITLYQLGWRLGGKGASGRGEFDRIEEHGLHIWLGFYDNAFAMMKQAYDSLHRSPDAPLATLESAFKRHSFIIINEQVEGKYVIWPVECPEDPADETMPGEPRKYPALWDYFYRMMTELRLLFDQSGSSSSNAASGLSSPFAWAMQVLAKIGSGTEALGLSIGSQLLEAIHSHWTTLPADPADRTAQDHTVLEQLVDRFLEWIRETHRRLDASDSTARRVFILMDLTATVIRGVLAEGVLTHPDGINVLDRYDLREWLLLHGASEESVWSGPIRFLYDLGFAYRDGDANQPDFAAGTALRCIWRVFFAYQGAIFWKMQAGMGDTVFTPLYHLLRERGVQFEFFHRVRNLELSEDGKRVASIEISRQMTVKEGTYSPLRPAADGLECWPSEPLYDQLVEGEELRATRDSNGLPYNLESYWTPWKDREEVVLEEGRDFDTVIFGISLGSVPLLCHALVAANSRWQQMVTNVQTTRTIGLQLWLKPDLAEMGWTLPSPVMDGYVNPLNTWADMSHLLPRENWPPDLRPQNIAYLCGTVTDDVPVIAPDNAPEREYRRAEDISRTWLETSAGGLWPNVVAPPGSASLDWEQLVAPPELIGPARLSTQFWKMNMDPSERYVLAVKNSSAHRIKPGDSGFDNLILVGDWTDCGLNVGCIEAATISGLLGANALLGREEADGILGFPDRNRGGV